MGLILLLGGIGFAFWGIVGLVACIVTWDGAYLIPNAIILAAGLGMGALGTAILE